MRETTVLCVSVLAGEDLLSGPDWIKVENSKTLIDVLVQVSGTRALGQQVQVIVSKEPSFTEAALVQVLNPVSLLDDSRSIYVKFLLRSSVLSLKQSVDLKCKAERDTDPSPFHDIQREYSMKGLLSESELESSSKLNLPFESTYLNKMFMEHKIYQASIASSKPDIRTKQKSSDAEKLTTWQQQCEIKSHLKENESKSESMISLSLDGLTKWTQSSSSVEDSAKDSVGLSGTDSVKSTGIDSFQSSVADSFVRTRTDSAQFSAANFHGQSGADTARSPAIDSVVHSVEGSIRKYENREVNNGEGKSKCGLSSKSDVATNESKMENKGEDKLAIGKINSLESGKQKSQQTGKSSPCNARKPVSKLISKNSNTYQVKKPIAKPKVVSKASCSIEKKESRPGVPSLRTKPAKHEIGSSDRPKIKSETVNTSKTAGKPNEPSCSAAKCISNIKKPSCPKVTQEKKPFVCSVSMKHATPTRILTKRPGLLGSVPPAKRTVSPCFSASRKCKITGKNKETNNVSTKPGTARTIDAKRPLCSSKKRLCTTTSDVSATTKGDLNATTKGDVNATTKGDLNATTKRDVNAKDIIDKDELVTEEDKNDNERLPYVEENSETSHTTGNVAVDSIVDDKLTHEQEDHGCIPEVSSASNMTITLNSVNTSSEKYTEACNDASETVTLLVAKDKGFENLQMTSPVESESKTVRPSTLEYDPSISDFSTFLESFSKEKNEYCFDSKDVASMHSKRSRIVFDPEASAKGSDSLEINKLDSSICEKDAMISSSPINELENFRLGKPISVDPDILYRGFKTGCSIKRSPGSRIALFCEDALGGSPDIQSNVRPGENVCSGDSISEEIGLDSVGLSREILLQSNDIRNDDEEKGMKHSSPTQSFLDKSLNIKPKSDCTASENSLSYNSVKRTYSLNEEYFDSSSKKSGFFDHLKERTIVPAPYGVEKEGVNNTISTDHVLSNNVVAAEKSLLNVTIDRDNSENSAKGPARGDDKDASNSIVFLRDISRDNKANRTFTVDETEQKTLISPLGRGPANENNYSGAACEENSGEGPNSEYSYNLSDNVVCHVRKKWDLRAGIMDQLLQASLLDLSKKLSDTAVRIIKKARKESTDEDSELMKTVKEKKVKSENDLAELCRNLRRLDTQLLEIEESL